MLLYIYKTLIMVGILKLIDRSFNTFGNTSVWQKEILIERLTNKEIVCV